MFLVCVRARVFLPLRPCSCTLLTVHRDFIVAYKTSNGSVDVGSLPETVVCADGPDLLLRFTPGGALRAALTTDGFPPWYLRLTEIQ